MSNIRSVELGSSIIWSVAKRQLMLIGLSCYKAAPLSVRASRERRFLP
jgi:hypothetical protein